LKGGEYELMNERIEVIEHSRDRVWRVRLNGVDLGSVARDRTAFGHGRLITRGAFAKYTDKPDQPEYYYESLQEAVDALVQAWFFVWVGMQRLKVEPILPPSPKLSRMPRKPKVPKAA
jgi:hypothetical protein